MALNSDYTAGTISVSANGTAVTGAGTAWQISGFKSGDMFFADGWFSVVASVESNTALTLEAPWRGGALSGAAYILRRASENAAVAEQARKLITLLGGSGNLEALGGLVGVAGSVPVFTGPGTMGLLTRQDLTQGVRYDAQVADIAARAAYNGAAEGFAVLVGNTGDGRAAVYSREGAAGNWSAPAYITGPAITLDITEVDEVPYGTPPDATLTPKSGGYDLAFEIPRGMIIEPGTTTTLAPGQPAAVTFVPIAGGYRLDIALPKGDTGDIAGVTPFWVTRLSTDTDAEAARAGLGANDAANLTVGTLPDARVPASLTPDKAFRRGNILGTVLQSGGVPTGAIIEQGSNASGRYVRFADGTQICWGSGVLLQTTSAVAGSMFNSPTPETLTFPAAFISPPIASALPDKGKGGSGVVLGNVANGYPTATQIVGNFISPLSGASGYLGYIAVGRWF